jgi:hypothetical protein
MLNTQSNSILKGDFKKNPAMMNKLPVRDRRYQPHHNSSFQTPALSAETHFSSTTL